MFSGTCLRGARVFRVTHTQTTSTHELQCTFCQVERRSAGSMAGNLKALVLFFRNAHREVLKIWREDANRLNEWIFMQCLLHRNWSLSYAETKRAADQLLNIQEYPLPPNMLAKQALRTFMLGLEARENTPLFRDTMYSITEDALHLLTYLDKGECCEHYFWYGIVVHFLVRTFFFYQEFDVICKSELL